MAKYDHLLTDRTFVGVGAGFTYDEIADLDYRVNVGPSIGYYFLKDNSFKFRADVGPSYVFERQGGVGNDYLAPRIGERFEWAITCTSKLFQSSEFILSVDDSDKYLINSEIGLESALSTELSLVFAVRDNYDNQPSADRDGNDLQLITALKVAL